MTKFVWFLDDFSTCFFVSNYIRHFQCLFCVINFKNNIYLIKKRRWWLWSSVGYNQKKKKKPCNMPSYTFIQLLYKPYYTICNVFGCVKFYPIPYTLWKPLQFVRCFARLRFDPILYTLELSSVKSPCLWACFQPPLSQWYLFAK